MWYVSLTFQTVDKLDLVIDVGEMKKARDLGREPFNFYYSGGINSLIRVKPGKLLD